MTFPELVMLAVVLLAGVPAMRRNATAAALVASWMVGYLWWAATGDGLAFGAFWLCDVAVITIIYAKTIARCGAKVYDSAWHQLRCLATDLTPWDRWIVALYLFGAWPVYISTLSDHRQYWVLWSIAIGQFLLAAGEAVRARRKVRRHVDAPDLPHTPSLYLAALPVACLPETPGIPSLGVQCRSARARGHG